MKVQPLTTKELAQKILADEEVFLLDIRSEEDYQDWSIQGEHVHSFNIPYQQLEKKAEYIQEKLPENQTLYVVCARGISSQKGADILNDAGVNKVTHLEGGMKAWSEYLEPVKLATLSDKAELYQFIRIGKGCLSYSILSDGKMAVIDPVRMTKTYKNFAKENNATIETVIDTHLHADHISGSKTLAEETDAAYYFPEADDEGLTFSYNKLKDGTTIHISESVTITAYYSPGHTIGSTSLIVNDAYIMTGDTLFIESIGRPDLAGKADDWVEDLHKTLYKRFRNLSAELIVLPGHFGSMEEINQDSTIQSPLKELYRNNELLQVNDKQQFIKLVTNHLPEQPNSHEQIRKINMGKTNPNEEERQEMEVGPNRCAV